MPSLADTAIRHALKRVEASQKQENLADGEGRGTGRLVLVLKPMPKRVTADWMAQQWRDGKRTKKKLGAYATNRAAGGRSRTLAGKAGVPKEIRDRLQNHALQDVSSKHYDRWNYMAEKRAGMAKWDEFVRAMLAKKRMKMAA